MFKQVANNLPSDYSAASQARAADSRGSELICAQGDLLVEQSTAQKPALLNREADYVIPRLWCRWPAAYVGRRMGLAIFRALTDGERQIVTRRRDELEAGCAPFADFEKDAAADAIAAMLDGFRALRHMDDELTMMAVQGLLRLLAPFPLWAIEQGCLAIQGGDAWLDGEKLSRKYPPNDAEIRCVIAEIVKPYIEKRDDALALLSAPVEERRPEEPKPTLAELKEKYGPNFGLNASVAASAAAEMQIPKIDASRYSPQDLERLASLLPKRDAA